MKKTIAIILVFIVMTMLVGCCSNSCRKCHGKGMIPCTRCGGKWESHEKGIIFDGKCKRCCSWSNKAPRGYEMCPECTDISTGSNPFKQLFL